MIELNASFIIFYQKDTDDRERNLIIKLNFLCKHYSDVEIIVVQQFKDAEERNNFKCLPVEDKRIKHIILDNDTEYWNKMTAYNIGLKQSKYDILFYNDVDTFFNPDNIVKAHKIITEQSKILIPSGLEFIDIGLDLIEEFKDNLDYKFLLDKYNANKDIFKCCNTGGPGGGLAGKKDTFIELNGFNPNFKGWGFEDDETKLRFLRLGKPISFLPHGTPIFHLYHRDAKRGSSQCKFFDFNKQIRDKVQKLPDAELIEYNKSWTI